MELTPIKIPDIPLPFDIPVLMHPPVDHFIIALPLVVLLLELVNVFAKKKAIGVVSFFLLVLTVIAAIAAYLTGTVDGKEAWDLLSQAGQAELKDHKILGTYLMLASAVVLLFKLLSAIINRGLMKAIFLAILIFFVAGILKQGKEGGELVYVYGANVKVVKTMDDEIFELKDELSDYQEEEKEAEEEAKAAADEAAKVQVEQKASDKETNADIEKAVKAETENAVHVTEDVEEAAGKVKAAEAVVVEAAAAAQVANNADIEKAVKAETENAVHVTEDVEEAAAETVEVVPAPAAEQAEIATH
jgi:uncharacterized membrane protein